MTTNTFLKQIANLQNELLTAQKMLDALKQSLLTAGFSGQPASSAAAKPTCKRSSRSKPLTFCTFAYRYPHSSHRLTRLYQALLHAGWIAPDTTPDSFLSLFEGNPTHVRIKWTGTQQHLYYLIRRIVERELVSLPQGVTLWLITESHFVDKNSRAFRCFNKQKEPVKAKSAIDRLVDILDPSGRDC